MRREREMMSEVVGTTPNGSSGRVTRSGRRERRSLTVRQRIRALVAIGVGCSGLAATY